MSHKLAFTLAIIAFFPTGFGPAQQASPPASSPPASTQTPLTVNLGDPGVIAPELLPGNIPTTGAKDCENLDGTVVASAVIDASGQPQQVFLPDSHGTDLDKMALIIAGADRFKPGTSNGAPVAVALAIEIKMRTCVEDVPKSRTGQYTVRLRSQPVQKLEPPSNLKDSSATLQSIPNSIGGRISAPEVARSVEAEYSDTARERKISGICMVSLVVDTHGMPQHVRVVKSLEPTLDQMAIEAVEQYRFKPAMRDGKTPVPVTITIEVGFF